MSRDPRAVLADVVAHIERARRQLGGRTAAELAAGLLATLDAQNPPPG